MKMNIEAFWNAVLTRDAQALRLFFTDDAYINWHCTNEHFSPEEYIRANCEYPGNWDGEIKRIETLNNIIITATHVFSKDSALSFHVVSFIQIREEKICAMDEYWGDDAPPPQWRLHMGIGSPIR